MASVAHDLAVGEPDFCGGSGKSSSEPVGAVDLGITRRLRCVADDTIDTARAQSIACQVPPSPRTDEDRAVVRS